MFVRLHRRNHRLARNVHHQRRRRRHRRRPTLRRRHRALVFHFFHEQVIQHPADQQDQEERRHQHHQADELVRKRFGQLPADVVIQQTLPRDAHHVTENGNRHGGDDHDQFLPQWPGAEERDGDADGDERHQRTQPRARLGDVERPQRLGDSAHVDLRAGAIRVDAGEAQRHDRNLGREGLKRAGDVAVDQPGQIKDREPDVLHDLPPHQHQHDAEEGEGHGAALDELVLPGPDAVSERRQPEDQTSQAPVEQDDQSAVNAGGNTQRLDESAGIVTAHVGDRARDDHRRAGVQPRGIGKPPDQQWLDRLFQQLIAIDEQVIQPDGGNADRMAPVGFAVNRIGLIPEPAQHQPIDRREERREDADLDPGLQREPQVHRLAGVAVKARRSLVRGGTGHQRSLRVQLGQNGRPPTAGLLHTTRRDIGD